MMHQISQLKRLLNYKPSTVAAVFLAPVLALSGHAFADSHMEKSGNQDQLVAAKQHFNKMNDAIASYTVEQKDAAVKAMQQSLSAIDKRVDEVEGWSMDRWNQLSDSARATRQDALRNLRKARNETAEWIGSLRYSTAENWDEVKQGFAASTDRLKDAYNDALESLKTEENKS